MMRNGVRALCPALVLAVAATGPAAAELARWDQERVTALAAEFSAEARKVYDAVYRAQVSNTVGSGQVHDYHLLKDRVRVAKNEARHLANALKDGKGHDETLHAYMRLMEVVRDAREAGQRMYLEKPILDSIAAADDTLRRLAPYYDPKALERPAAAKG